VEGIFDGVRVLDFTQVLAGPTATLLLVELGAEVIKVEARGGELGRVLPRVEKGRSGYFVQQNRGKRSVCVDLKNDRGRELILDLVPECDVMIQNFAHGVMERLGFGYEALRERNPRIVTCNMSAFGDEGPLASRPGYDGIAGSWAGVFHMLGYPDQAPILPGVSPGDVLTGVHAFGGVAAALYHRERTGRGQEVKISLLDAYTTVHEVNWQEWSLSGGESQPGRAGNTHPIVGAVGVFAVGDDGYLALAAVNDTQWSNLAKVMGRPELATGGPWVTGEDRMNDREAVNAFVEQWLAGQSSRDDAIAAIEAVRVPAAPVLTVAEAAEHPSLHAAGALRWVDDDVLGRVLVPGMPLKFGDSPHQPQLRTRQLGEDNRWVVCEMLGRSIEDYEALVDAGVLHHDPAT